MLNCPNCGTPAQPPPIGDEIQCTGCGHEFTVAEGRNGITEVLSEVTAPVAERRGLLSFLADASVVNHFVNYEPRFATKHHADAALAIWRDQMPEVDSVYQPSGASPLSGILIMLAGFLFSVAGGVVAEIIAAAACAIALVLCFGCNALVAMAGFVVFIFVAILIVAVVLAVIVPFAVGGYATAYVTNQFGRWGKNRSVLVASLFSIAAAVVASVIFCTLFAVYAKPMIDELELFDLNQFTLDRIYIGAAGVGLIAAILAAWLVSVDMVSGDKFCEKCESYMDRSDLKKLQPASLRAMVHAVNNNDPELSMKVLEGPIGDRGEAIMFYCPNCSTGVLEIRALFEAHWMQPDSDGTTQRHDLVKEWLAASAHIPEERVSDIRAWQLEELEKQLGASS